MARVVLDASAILALLNGEPGSRIVEENLPEAAVSAVNLSEVIAKLSERGMPEAAIRVALEGLGLDVHPFDGASAFSAGTLRPATRGLGLSMGDRACLTLGLSLSAPVLTADGKLEEAEGRGEGPPDSVAGLGHPRGPLPQPLDDKKVGEPPPRLAGAAMIRAWLRTSTSSASG